MSKWYSHNCDIIDTATQSAIGYFSPANPVESFDTDPTAHRRARLAAAAPELLAALERILENMAPPIHGTDSRYGREYADAAAAIAKARGRV